MEHPPPGLELAHVLVVDDDESVHVLFADLFDPRELSISCHSSAELALSAFTPGSYAVALIDHNLPGAPGLQLLKALKQRDPLLEVILITGYASLETAIEALQAGAFDYIEKPFYNVGIIVERVRHAVERRRLSVTNRQLLAHLQQANQDLTERNQRLLKIQEQLWQSEASFRALIECSPEAIAVHRLGRVVYANPTFVSYLGFDRLDDLIGEELIQLVYPEDRPAVRARLEELSRSPGGRSASQERFVRRDGRVVVSEVATVPLVFRGEPALASVARDVTERKELQSQLLAADRMASLGTLASGLVHEVNNPLAFVLTNLGYVAEELGELRDQWQDALRSLEGTGHALGGDAPRRIAELLTALEEARHGAERVRQVMRDLRVFARGGEGPAVPVDVRRVLEASIGLAWNEIRHRARLEKHFAEVPSVAANESLLGQAFLSLILNAARAMPEGAAGQNELRITTGTDARGRAIVEVSDTGPGISPKDLSHVFDPFFAGSPTGVGSGVGLSVCSEIVTSLGGEIAVESELGSGSCFRVALPGFAAAAEAAPERPAQAASARRGRVLVIDDEESVGASVRRILAREHEVVLETDGRSALVRLAGGEQYDVILCDLMMPELAGMDLHEELSRSRPDLAERMVFMTGGAFTQRARDFLDRVPNTRIDKPFEPRAVRELVRGRVRA